jgi:hypothetical protein
MIMWAGILIGILFAWIAYKVGLYEIWAAFFNILIAIYLSLYLAPVFSNSPESAEGSYRNMVLMAGIAVGTFVILEGASYLFLTGQVSISFPRIIDTVVAASIGFLAGFLVWSFVAVLIYVSPISRMSFVQSMGLAEPQANKSYVSWWCGLINSFASNDEGYVPKDAIGELAKAAGDRTVPTRSRPRPGRPGTATIVDPNKPPKTVRTEVEKLGPPPEADLQDIIL